MTTLEWPRRKMKLEDAQATENEQYDKGRPTGAIIWSVEGKAPDGEWYTVLHDVKEEQAKALAALMVGTTWLTYDGGFGWPMIKFYLMFIFGVALGVAGFLLFLYLS